MADVGRMRRMKRYATRKVYIVPRQLLPGSSGRWTIPSRVSAKLVPLDGPFTFRLLPRVKTQGQDRTRGRSRRDERDRYSHGVSVSTAVIVLACGARE